VVSFAQVEEAVDHAPQPAARGPHDLGAMEQLAAAHEHDALGHEPEPRAQAGVVPEFRSRSSEWLSSNRPFGSLKVVVTRRRS